MVKKFICMCVCVYMCVYVCVCVCVCFYFRASCVFAGMLRVHAHILPLPCLCILVTRLPV